MKTKFDNKSLPHQWAHQLQSFGRANSMRFDGPSIYSYGTEIARIITRKSKGAYLVNTTRYSSTTQRHQSLVMRAIPGDAIEFKFSGVRRGGSLRDVTGKEIFDYAIESAAIALEKASRSRSYKDMFLSDHAKWIERAKQASEFFGLRRKVDDKVIERHAETVKRERARQAKEEKDRQTKLIAEQAKQITEWLEGSSNHFPYAVQKIYLRVIFKECELVTEPMKIVQTSRGVTIPHTEAERAFRFAIARRDKGWHRNGETCPVGQYQLDAVNEFGIVAGCHRIEWSEVERFAKQQGWL